MHSTQTASEVDPRDVFMIESLLAGGAKPPASEPAPSVSPPSAPPVNVAPDFSATPAPTVDATFRAAPDDVRIGDIRVDDMKPVDDEPAPKWVKRLVMSVLALCGAVTAAAWQQHGDTAKQVIADLTPSIVSASSDLASSVLGSSSSEQPASPVPAATADQAAAPAPPAQPATLAANTSSPDSAQQMQSMARDLASMGQEIEQLKASIEQMKAAQAQMATAKASVPRTTEATVAAPAPRAKMPPPVRSVAAPASRPKPASAPAAYSPPPVATAAPMVPPLAPAPPLPERAQATMDDGEPVMRPPMPLR